MTTKSIFERVNPLHVFAITWVLNACGFIAMEAVLAHSTSAQTENCPCPDVVPLLGSGKQE